MYKMLIALSLINLLIGLLFGNIGHLYSLLVFPLISSVQGYLGLNKYYHNYHQTFFYLLIGGFFFFFGLLAGVLTFSVHINYSSDTETLSATSINQALVYSVATALIYYCLYCLFGMLAAFLCSESNQIRRLMHKSKNGKDKDLEI